MNRVLKRRALPVGTLLTVLVLCGSPAAHAQVPAPLFASNEPVEMTLEVPLRTLIARRQRRPEVEGFATYQGPAGDTVRLDVEVRTRGRNRLESCSFPPLSLNFRRRQVEGTLFAGQNRLKLVTQCRSSDQFSDYLELEYLIYRIYQQVSDYAYRARPVHVRYVATDRKDRVTEAPAFLLEHIEELAARVDMRVAEVEQIAIGDIDPQALATLSVFQYFIGNTDWSALRGPDGDECCHNGDVLAATESGGPYVVVPYDFDQSGLISTPYAEPREFLPISTVRHRLYRGFCATNDYVMASIERFNDARPAIETLLQQAQLGERNREEAREFISESYALLNDAEERESAIFGRCR